MKICDCHNDFFGELKTEKLQKYVDECSQAGVKFLSGSYWTTKRVGDIFADITNRKTMITNPKCFVLHIEDLSFIKDQNSLQNLIDLKPFSCSLTWNFDNQFAGGSYGEKTLTKRGKKLIQKLQENSILLDLAHLNKKSFFDAANLTKYPPYISHAGFCFIHDDKRNLDKEQIKFIVENNGFMGMFFYDKLSMEKHGNLREFSVENIAQNIACFVDKFGCENIGIGSDFYGIESPPKNLNNYEQFKNLKTQLKNLGMADFEIKKIFHKNLQTYLKKTCVVIK